MKRAYNDAGCLESAEAWRRLSSSRRGAKQRIKNVTRRVIALYQPCGMLWSRMSRETRSTSWTGRGEHRRSVGMVPQERERVGARIDGRSVS
jgi:hypothetical protein